MLKVTYNLFLFFSVICSSYLKIHALKAEGILNGAIANQSNFKYQAAILGRRNASSANYLLCSGTVVASMWILSVARCFLLNSEDLKDLIFTALVGFNDLNTPGASFQNIKNIYTEDYVAYYSFNCLAMAQTEQAMSLGDTVDKIGIAPSGNLFFNQSGIVTGYGSNKYAVQERDENAEDEEDEVNYNFPVQVLTDFTLRNTTVKVKSPRVCSYNFINYMYKKFCGVAVYIQGKNTGLCRDDIGSPLVINGVVVGISTETNFDCSDTFAGSLYTDVGEYFDFIRNVLNGKFSRDIHKHTVYIK